MIAPLRDYEPDREAGQASDHAPAPPALIAARHTVAAALLPAPRRVPPSAAWPEWRAWLAVALIAFSTAVYVAALWRRVR
jgi:hypothetical protein